MDINPEMVQALSDSSSDLAQIVGVNGFDIGLDADGEPTIRVMVTDPASPPAALPESLGTFSVQLVAGAPKMCSVPPDTSFYNPVLGGTETARATTGLFANGSGTLGCVLRDVATLESVGISCAHVIAGLDPTAVPPQQEIWQPNALGARVGRLLRWELPTTPPFIPGGMPSGFWDAAVCSVERPARVGDIAEIGRVTGFGSARLGDHVRKRGSTTRVTHGTVSGLFGSYLIMHHSAPTGWWMLGQIEISVIPDLGLNPGGAFALEGDSGSVVVNDANEIVGLLHAGGTGSTGYAMDFGPLAIALGVTM